MGAVCRSTELILDPLTGAIVRNPVLWRLTDPRGTLQAYALSAIVPVGWVLTDCLCISRRFNSIAGLFNLNALGRGSLVLWSVEGVLCALKDASGAAMTAAIFVGSPLVGPPAVRALAEQSPTPSSPPQESTLGGVFGGPPLARRLSPGAVLPTAVSAATGATNFAFNLTVISPPSGAEASDARIARVGSTNRLVVKIAESSVVWSAALWLIFQVIHTGISRVAGRGASWDLIELRDAWAG